SVQALAIDEGDIIYAGTADGIFALAVGPEAGESEWEVAHQGLLHPNVRALAVQGEALYAATSVGRDVRSPRGVFQFERQTQRWRPTGLTNVDIQTLAIRKQVGTTALCLLAGTLRQGLFRSDNGGNSWRSLPQWKEISGALASNGSQITVTAASFSLVEGDTIRASGQIRQIVRQIVRQRDQQRDQQNIDAEPNSEPAQYQINTPFKPDLLPGTPFSLGTGLTNPNVTALLFDGDQLSGEINNDTDDATDGREPVIFAGTAGSGVFRSDDGGDRWQEHRQGLTDLEIRCLAKDADNRLWTGTQMRGIFYSRLDSQSENQDNSAAWHSYSRNLDNTEVKTILPLRNELSGELLAAGSGILLNLEGTHAVPLQLGDYLHIVRPPQSKVVTTVAEVKRVPSLEAGGLWTVRDRSGFIGHLTTHSPTDLTFLPAAETDPWVSEKGQIDYPPEDQRQPILTLIAPLQHSYDPATVTISANVAVATQGETVEETLGSGEGGRSHQRFTLNQPPLTYTASSTGSNSSLAVRVNGVLWQEVVSLYGRKDNDPVYFVRLDDNGTPHITFGDGISGTRLPSGIENITATYRTGIGPEGEVAAERLSLLKTKPLGVVAVNNPLSATGAAPPETMQTARRKAPATLRTLDRIVSLSDFEDFARGYPGIGKAQSRAVWTARRVQWVQLTIAGLSDELGQYKPLDETAPLYSQIVAAIDQSRDPIQQVQIDFCEILQFNLAAKVLIDARYLPETVMAQVETSLRTTFAFNERDFGQAVTASEAIAAIQQVEGVVAVDLDALYRVGQSKNRRDQLPAEVARWDGQSKILPAQLLLLSATGIELEAVERL
ncbi:MAG: putative baseplate assembly protein, partial [Phormidesmis sp.]